MTTWPDGIPFFTLRSGYGAQPGDNVLRTPMDVGPAKVRRRTTSAPSIITGAAYMTREQAQRFEAFWRDTLKDGALSFTLADGLYRRRNMLVQSEDFSAGWIPQNATVTQSSGVAIIEKTIATGTVGQIYQLDALNFNAQNMVAFVDVLVGAGTAQFVAIHSKRTFLNNNGQATIFNLTTKAATTNGIGFAPASGRIAGVITLPGGALRCWVFFLSQLGSSGGVNQQFGIAPCASGDDPRTGGVGLTVAISRAQLSQSSTLIDYEPVGASYPATHVTRGGLKTYRIVGVPDFGLMGLGHRVPVTLEVLP